MNTTVEIVIRVGSTIRGDFPALKDLWEKVRKDNLRLLISVVGWNILISVVPILIGIVAITIPFISGTTAQHAMIRQLSRATKGVLQPHYIQFLVSTTVKHQIIFWCLAIGGAVWASSNIGFAFTSAFSAIFEVGERPFWERRLVELSMFFVVVTLMVIILSGAAGANLFDQTISSKPLSPVIAFCVHTIVSVVAAFLLFAAIFVVFPNTKTQLRLSKVWRGAMLSAVLFQLSTYVWPLYEGSLSKYGGIVFPIILLIAWIMVFSVLALLGAEVVAISAIREANREGRTIGPEPSNAVPQHRVLRRV